MVSALLAGCQSTVLPGDAVRLMRMSVNATELAYVDQGRGTPVVFVHGTAGDWRIWEGQRPAVATQYRFVAYSRRYHAPNGTLGDGKDYSQAQHAADLAAFIQGLQSGPVHLVGSSYGAQIALLATSEHPELVRTLTVAEPGLANLVAGTPEGKAATAAFVKPFGAVRDAAKAGDHVRAAQLMVDAALGETGSAERLPPSQQVVLRDNAPTVALQMEGARTTIGCTQLKTIKAPTLIFGGELSPQLMRMTNDALAQCLGGEVVRATVPGANHLVHSMNAPAYNEALLAFLLRH
jgi:pimeloyl-ACP methyl ester carboxylesterase